ncbi:hypothetical protein HDU83_005289 [Entophlyctis luteolus]|nr:hypothetical protein HDU83_005289 [Entophlyctis luteolus]
MTSATRLAVFSSMAHERAFLSRAAAPYETDGQIAMTTIGVRLDAQTVGLAAGYDAVSAFVNDHVSAPVLYRLRDFGVTHVALRSAGFNNVDIAAAKDAGIIVSRIPEYSPHAVAEFAAALVLAANRRIVPAVQRVRQGNFTLNGLVGFDLYEKTVGVVGTGKIGQAFIKIMRGFGCQVLCYDPFPSPVVAAIPGCRYVGLDELFSSSRVISLHCPLTPDTTHLINAKSLEKMIDGVLLVNTSRGALINSIDLIRAIKSRKVGAAGLDVYEYETGMFFEDHSADEFIEDKWFSRLLSFNNVIVTGHQGFLTTEALTRICETTLLNVHVLSASDTNANAETRAICEHNRIC